VDAADFGTPATKQSKASAQNLPIVSFIAGVLQAAPPIVDANPGFMPAVLPSVLPVKPAETIAIM
jgi:hypothetical protein